MKYWGQTKNEVKKRVEQHKYSFSTPKKVLNRKGTLVSIQEQIEEKKSKSELASYIWSLKEKGVDFKITWKIEKKAFPYKIGSSDCNLCAWEKTSIAKSNPKTTLNSRNEIFHKCREKSRYKLKNFLPP